MRLRVGSTVGVVMSLWLIGIPVAAQNPGRVLNGHRFLPSEQVPSPFVTSYISASTGGGAAFDLKTPFIDVDGDTLGTLVGNVGFMSLSFAYQQMVTNWLALRGGLAGNARAGVDEQAILAQGLTGLLGWSVGGSALILHRPTWLLTGSLDFGGNKFVVLNPFEFAQSVIDNGGLTPDNDLVSSNNTISGRAMLRAGWAPKTWLGATAAVEGGVGDVSDLNSKGIYGGAASVGVDFRQLSWWSVGLSTFFRYESFNQNGANLASSNTRLGMGVYYTGRDDFSVGLEVSSIKFAVQSTGASVSAALASFNIRYWFTGG